MDTLVSLIIPVYNVESYIRRCIDSVIDQTYENLEIILVDDGSTDNCPMICEEYKIKDYRIQVIHQDNKGLAAARNTGLKNAHGYYVAFLDSDDYVSKYYIENLIAAITYENSDLAISMFINVIDNEEWKKEEATGSLLNYRAKNNHDCLEDMLYQRGIETSAPGKLFTMNMIGDLCFPEGKLYEDIVFTTTMICRSKKIAIVDNVDYFYYQRNNSIQYQTFNTKKMDCIWHSLEMISLVKSEFPDLEEAAEIRFFGGLCNILFQIPRNQYNDERKIIWNYMKKIRPLVLKSKKARLKSKFAALLSYFGEGILKYAYAKTQVRGQVTGSRR